MYMTWLCEECGYVQSHASRAQSLAPDYCPRCRRNSVWSPEIMGRGQRGGGWRDTETLDADDLSDDQAF
jgi:hypothetical protein